jgi:chorismate mutase
MEASVQPSRDQRQKVTDEIAKLKYKDPSSPASMTPSLSEMSETLSSSVASPHSDSWAAIEVRSYRGILKQIRNMEASVQPSRDQRQKVTDEIAKLKYK